MTNNDILRRVRYILSFDDSKMISIFGHTGCEVTREQVSNWLKKEVDDSFQKCGDKEFATFLNGLIIEKRGRKDGPQPEPETELSNNIIFMKLRIAFNLKAEDILEILESEGIIISKHELSAFFRRKGHKHYRECQDQILRNFLTAVQWRLRPKH
jgi:uncharacterized protein YehS (DUF1456 family)